VYINSITLAYGILRAEFGRAFAFGALNGTTCYPKATRPDANKRTRNDGAWFVAHKWHGSSRSWLHIPMGKGESAISAHAPIM
jgi:hypothetical protein